MPQNKGNNGAINRCPPVSSTQSREKYPLHETRKALRPRGLIHWMLWERFFVWKHSRHWRKALHLGQTQSPRDLLVTGPELVYLGLVSPTLKEAPKNTLDSVFPGSIKRSFLKLNTWRKPQENAALLSPPPRGPVRRGPSLTRGFSAILCLWQRARPASPRWRQRGFAGEQRRNEIPLPSPNTKGTQRPFLIFSPLLTEKTRRLE